MANVRLYYLGGLGQEGRTVTIVRSRGKVYNLPPAGESLELPEFIANDLIRRHKIRLREGVFEAFTLDGRIAKTVKDAGTFLAQRGGGQKKITLSDVLKNFSKEELEAAIAEASDDFDPDAEEEVEVPKKKAVKKTAEKPLPKKGAAKRVSKAEPKESGSAPVTPEPTPEKDNDDFLDQDDEDDGDE